MKKFCKISIKLIPAFLLCLLWSCTSTSNLGKNTIEYDDMYFSAKDRKNAEKPEEIVVNTKPSIENETNSELVEIQTGYVQDYIEENQFNQPLDYRTNETFFPPPPITSNLDWYYDDPYCSYNSGFTNSWGTSSWNRQRNRRLFRNSFYNSWGWNNPYYIYNPWMWGNTGGNALSGNTDNGNNNNRIVQRRPSDRGRRGLYINPRSSAYARSRTIATNTIINENVNVRTRNARYLTPSSPSEGGTNGFIRNETPNTNIGTNEPTNNSKRINTTTTRRITNNSPKTQRTVPPSRTRTRPNNMPSTQPSRTAPSRRSSPSRTAPSRRSSPSRTAPSRRSSPSRTAPSRRSSPSRR